MNYKSSGVTLKEVGGKNCYQIDKEQYITINIHVTKYTMIFNIYVNSDSTWKTLIDIADVSDSSLFLRKQIWSGNNRLSDYTVPTKKWCKIIFNAIYDLVRLNLI